MILAGLIGIAAGVVSGLLGVGGGILFVPALTLALSLTQVRAEATSLLAIIPVAAVGAVRQWRYGNVDVRDGTVVGVLSAAGVTAGVALANVVPQRALKLAFAAVMLFVAAQLLRRVRAGRAGRGADGSVARAGRGAARTARRGGPRRGAPRTARRGGARKDVDGSGV